MAIEGTLPSTHILADLGMTIRQVGDELHSSAAISPFMHVPGTSCLRTSILAAWVDTVTGVLAIDEAAPHVPVTFDLSVDLYRLPTNAARFGGRARVLKSGRNALLTEVELDTDGVPLGLATASFMPIRIEGHGMTTAESIAGHAAVRGRLSEPYADRAQCVRGPAGTASIGRRADGLNAVDTIQGGLLGLVIEESALSLAPGHTLSSLSIHYMRPARVGPAVAKTERRGDFARIVVTDAGSDDREVAVATARYLDSPSLDSPA
jgi:acyl-coenzyme A thioesterase PaaI-like protein